MRSAATVTIYTFAILMSLGEFDINLGPLIAGAGIAGVALGFGAQSIVKDFLSGFFMLVEDQYAVGDIVDVGELRVLLKRSACAQPGSAMSTEPYGMFPTARYCALGNKSQQWARAVLDIEVAYDTDIDLASRVIKEAADAVWLEHLPKKPRSSKNPRSGVSRCSVKVPLRSGWSLRQSLGSSS